MRRGRFLRLPLPIGKAAKTRAWREGVLHGEVACNNPCLRPPLVAWSRVTSQALREAGLGRRSRRFWRLNSMIEYFYVSEMLRLVMPNWAPP
jgi:hypothetical protein